ncbi:hypothetical protein OE88DRAFT_1739875 [Heliocybe sulcata]|uniref:Uncharacterized protein n=1 Tax=Heliocybe sulcata TaxID=5364 RepID=A0A5C3MKJ7_9AGAM|nr:hypothetical protein OE88DRAFT_1739875 [Heliocybe sulcata]
MVLIHRYHASVEHSEFLSTSPRTPSRTRFATEAAAWADAACPPMEDIRDVFSRLKSDPDLSQENIIYQALPPCLFVAALLLASSLLRGGDVGDAGRRVVVYGGMVCVAVVTLRIVVWLGAMGANGSGEGRARGNGTSRCNSPLLKQVARQLEGIPM